MLYNASEAGRLVALDVADRPVVATVAIGAHLRGLSVNGRDVLVGTSPFVTSRAERRTNQGSLAVLDRSTLARIAVVPLGGGGPVGDVNEIRSLDGDAQAHAGPPTLVDPALEASFSVPERPVDPLAHHLRDLTRGTSGGIRGVGGLRPFRLLAARRPSGRGGT